MLMIIKFSNILSTFRHISVVVTTTITEFILQTKTPMSKSVCPVMSRI